MVLVVDLPAALLLAAVVHAADLQAQAVRLLGLEEALRVAAVVVLVRLQFQVVQQARSPLALLLRV